MKQKNKKSQYSVSNIAFMRWKAMTTLHALNLGRCTTENFGRKNNKRILNLNSATLLQI